MGDDHRHAPHWVVFSLTYMVGALAAFIVGNLALLVLYDPDQIGSVAELGRTLLIATLLAGLAGLGVFWAIFGTVTGRWRGWRFWLIAPALVYGAAMMSGYWLMSGHISFPEAAAILLGLPFGLGFLALRLTGN